MKTRFLGSLILGIAFFNNGGAQTITREEFLDRLKSSHPLFEKENLTSRIERKEQSGIAGAQDWNLLSSLNYRHEEPALAIFGPEKTDAVSFGAGVERLFWRTGGRLSTSMTIGRVDLELDPLYGLPDSYYQNQFAVTYSHPLLQNRGGFLDRIQYELKQFDIDFSEIHALENQESFLAESEAKFLEWAFLSRQKEIIGQRLRLSEEALNNTKKKREANLVDQVDVLRAEDAVRIANQNLVLTESRWKSVQAELAVLSKDSGIYNLVPEYDLYKVESLPEREDALFQLKQNSRLIKSLDIRIRQLEFSRSGFEESIKPRLSLLAQFNLKNADENFGDALALDKPDFIGGLQFGVPLGNSTAKSMVARTDLQIAQLRMAREELLLDLEAGLSNLYIQIEELGKILTLNQEQIESSKNKTAEEMKLYNQGRIDLAFVIQSQDGEQNARLNYAMNALNYHILILEYKALTDALYF